MVSFPNSLRAYAIQLHFGYEISKKRADAFENDDFAPKFYPVLNSLRLLGLLGWAVEGAGAEHSAWRSARSRRGWHTENSDGVLAALDHQPVQFPRHAKAGILSPGCPVSQCHAAAADGFALLRSLIPNDAERIGEGRSGRGKRVPLDQRKERRKPVRCRTMDASLFGRGVGEGLGVHICPTRSTYAALRRGP